MFERFENYLDNKGEDYKRKIKIMAEMEMIGIKLKQLRKEHNLTQKQLAKKINVSQQQISKIEKSDDKIQLHTLKKVAHALGEDLVIALVNNDNSDVKTKKIS